MPPLALVIMGWGLAFLLTAICIALGVFSLCMVPVAIIAVLVDCRAMNREDVDRLVWKLGLKAKKGA
jgi:hypothetical protein